MCFITTKQSRPRKAKEDIFCWKILNSDYTPLFHSQYSPYKSGILNPIVKLIKYSDDCDSNLTSYIIEEGYHSYHTEDIAINNRRFNEFIIAEFVIPKDTLYYKNKEEYVSETIIMK